MIDQKKSLQLEYHSNIKENEEEDRLAKGTENNDRKKLNLKLYAYLRIRHKDYQREIGTKCLYDYARGENKKSVCLGLVSKVKRTTERW